MSRVAQLGGAGGNGPTDKGGSGAVLPPAERIIPLQGTDGLEQNFITRRVSQRLASGLNNLVEVAIQVSTYLTQRIESDDEGARERLHHLQRELRRVHAAADWLAEHIDSLVPGRDPWSDGVEPSQHHEYTRLLYASWLGEDFPHTVRGELSRWFPAIAETLKDMGKDADQTGFKLPLPSVPEYSPLLTETSFRRISKALEILEESTKHIRAIEREDRLAQTKQSGEVIVRTAAVGDDLAKSISEMVMSHKRRPGDREISRKGVVIADISPEVLLNDIAQGCQAILCYRNDELVGVSLFFLPERPPPHLSDLIAYFPDTKNAILDLALVSPSAQGSEVFETLMNATLTAIQATGAELIIGQVEHSNTRAERAYEKYGGKIYREIVHYVTAPSGERTHFHGLAIPVPAVGEERKAVGEIMGLV